MSIVLISCLIGFSGLICLFASVAFFDVRDIFYSIVASISGFIFVTLTVWIIQADRLEWRVSSIEEKNVSLVDNVAVSINKDRIVNLNTSLNKNFKEGDKVYAVSLENGPYLGIYYLRNNPYYVSSLEDVENLVAQ